MSPGREERGDLSSLDFLEEFLELGWGRSVGRLISPFSKRFPSPDHVPVLCETNRDRKGRDLTLELIIQEGRQALPLVPHHPRCQLSPLPRDLLPPPGGHYIYQSVVFVPKCVGAHGAC